MSEYLFGYETIGNVSTVANRLYLSRFYVDSQCTIEALKVYFVASGNVNIGIYDDDSGEPGNLLGYSTYEAHLSGWRMVGSFSISAPAGYYWIGASGPNIKYGTSGSWQSRYLNTIYGFDNFDPWNTGSDVSFADRLSIAAYGTLPKIFDAGTGQSVSVSIPASGTWYLPKYFAKGTGQGVAITTPVGTWYTDVTFDAGTGQSVEVSTPTGVWVAGYPIVTGISEAMVVDGKAGVVITGERFLSDGATAELCNNADYEAATKKVSQVITAQSDDELTITVDTGDLEPGLVSLFVTTSLGLRTKVAFAVILMPDWSLVEVATDAHNPRRRCHAAEVQRGCSIGDEFRSIARVTANGGSTWGGVTFDRFGGASFDGSGAVRYSGIEASELSVVFSFSADSSGFLAGTSVLDGSVMPWAGWGVWIDDDGIHATHSDGSTVADECMVAGSFADGQRHIATYVVDLTVGDHSLYIDSGSVSETTSIVGPLPAWMDICVGGLLHDNIAGAIHGIRLFEALLTEGEHQLYAESA